MASAQSTDQGAWSTSPPTAQSPPPEGQGFETGREEPDAVPSLITTTTKSFLTYRKGTTNPSSQDMSPSVGYLPFVCEFLFYFNLKQGFLSFTACLPISCFSSVTTTE